MLNLLQFKKKLFEGTVLVTGAGGCIGSWVLAILFKSGVSQVAFDLTSEKTRPKLILNDNLTLQKHLDEIPGVANE